MQHVVIVGAGVAGLSAGIHASRSGFRTTILEQHSIPGGLCTAWTRRGPSGRYTLEGCIHYVLGLGPGARSSGFGRLWTELGVDRPVLPVTELYTLRSPDGRVLPVPADAYELGRRLRAGAENLSRRDLRSIRRLVADIVLFARYDIPLETPAEVWRWDKIRELGRHYPGFLWRFLRYRFTSARSYARRFRNPFLRYTVARLTGYPDYPAIWSLMVLSRLHRGEAGYPLGGSLELAYDLEERFLQLGGTIRYGTRVTGVDRDAAAVVTSGGEVIQGDALVLASDLRESLGWLRSAGTPSALHESFLSFGRTGHAVAQVSLGVADECVGNLSSSLVADAGASLVLYPGRKVGGSPAHRLVIRQYGTDPTLAPSGCRTITCQVETDHDYWSGFADRVAYRKAKDRFAADVIRILDAEWPGLAACVEVVDVCSPLTTERYTANYRGSAHGLRPDRRAFALPVPYTAGGRRSVWFAGHWLTPGGGLHRAAQSGRYAVQQLCRELGVPFGANNATVMHRDPEHCPHGNRTARSVAALQLAR